jgi:hypothetical protein
MMFSSSILKLNALAMWAPKTAFNEELVLSRLIAFAFSHSLNPKLPIQDVRSSIAIGGRPDIVRKAQFGSRLTHQRHSAGVPPGITHGYGRWPQSGGAVMGETQWPSAHTD